MPQSQLDPARRRNSLATPRQPEFLDQWSRIHRQAQVWPQAQRTRRRGEEPWIELPNGRAFRTVCSWEIARQGGKTSKAPMFVQNTFVRQTAACLPTLCPVFAGFLERRFYCHRAQRPGGVAITLRHGSAKTDIEVVRNEHQKCKRAISRHNRAEKRLRP